MVCDVISVVAETVVSGVHVLPKVELLVRECTIPIASTHPPHHPLTSS
jgi:hypothetical protein